MLDHHLSADGSYKTYYGTYGKVDASHQDNKCSAQRTDQQVCGGGQYAQKIVDFQKLAGCRK